jgi:hypothetical protein
MPLHPCAKPDVRCLTDHSPPDTLQRTRTSGSATSTIDRQLTAGIYGAIPNVKRAGESLYQAFRCWVLGYAGWANGIDSPRVQDFAL